MFSPLNLPASRLPAWLQSVHSVLPIGAMGEVIRGTLASTTFPLASGAFLLLGAWCFVGFLVTLMVLDRRG